LYKELAVMVHRTVSLEAPEQVASLFLAPPPLAFAVFLLISPAHSRIQPFLKLNQSQQKTFPQTQQKILMTDFTYVNAIM
jgi:hypothetical protein